ncbi:MAG: UPF0147 family protein [Candidatus Aenigmarchaeota archaeon]|nr:UPF0147 family protein [Candidatus Aenigmarchaeota archaeon]
MEVNLVINVLEEIGNDRSVPKNVKSSIVKAMEFLSNEKLELEFRVNSAISVLDEVANDINLPPYSRTQIWNALSMLETINNEVKIKNGR